jgi:hypothetical protein
MQFEFRTILCIFLTITIPLALSAGASPPVRIGLTSAICTFWLSGFLVTISAQWKEKLLQQLFVLISGLVLFSLSFVATTYFVGKVLVAVGS